MFLNEIQQFSEDIDKITFIKIVIKDYYNWSKQNDYNNDLKLMLAASGEKPNISVDVKKINKSILTLDGILIHANKNTPVPEYLLNVKHNVCSCPSFRFQNYKIKNSCQHLEMYKKTY